MLRTIGGAIAGVVVWTIAITFLNLGLRHGWADYAAVEKAMTFTLSMKLARLHVDRAGPAGRESKLPLRTEGAPAAAHHDV